MLFDPEDIEAAVSALKSGDVILYPTDTIWGLGCDALNASAIKKIYRIKQRSESKSMIVGVDSVDMIKEYIAADKFNGRLISENIEGQDKPTTIILPGAVNLPIELIAEDGSVAFRILNDPFCLALVKEFGRPIVSTSANLSGDPSPANFTEIETAIKCSVDYLVKHRQLDTRIAKPSKIISLNSQGETRVIRE